MVVRYDRVIDTPREDQNLVMSIDLAPTFAEAAGVDAPRTDGKSFLSLLRSPGSPWRDDFLMEHLKGSVP